MNASKFGTDNLGLSAADFLAPEAAPWLQLLSAAWDAPREANLHASKQLANMYVMNPIVRTAFESLG